MGLFDRLRGRGRTGGRRAAGGDRRGTLDRGSQRADLTHLEEFVATRRGVEGFVEPRTAVTETTIVLVAADGEWTRRRIDGPDVVLETSTLTGAQLVALGTRTAGVMGTDELREAVVVAGRRCGEGMWPMPLPAELRRGLDSPIADFVNANADRMGGMLVAGHFLAEFVPDGLPWAHIDIAGPSYNTGSAWGCTPKGGTGVPVRTLLATIEGLIAD